MLAPLSKKALTRFLAVGSARYTWSFLKNCVKVVLGRRIYFNPRDLFFRQYVLHMLGVRSMRQITCTGFSGEGAGSQALMVMHAIAFARSNGLSYVHTPFKTIAHAELPMNEWAAAWESHFNLGAGEAACDLPPHEVVDYCYNFTDLELCFGQNRDELQGHFRRLIPEFRRKYYVDKAPRLTRKVTVAVHVRRGDAGPGHYLSTPSGAVLRTTAAVKAILDRHKLEYGIGVYSHGANAADFAELTALGARLFLNASGIWTIRELIEADILIMAKGSFSYCAALMSDGIKLCEPAVEPRLEEWIVASPDGSLDRAAFERQLDRLIQAKASAIPGGVVSTAPAH